MNTLCQDYRCKWVHMTDTPCEFHPLDKDGNIATTEEDIETQTFFKVAEPKWSIEVFRLSDEAKDRIHVDVQTHDVFAAQDMPAFADAVAEALARVKSLGGLRD